ncbi:MAG: methyl-accepting chemotaxis protein [Mesoflavibacter sp.]|nr:methyl-accepting chemotaxis protein [Mesoflavibacter sp.]
MAINIVDELVSLIPINAINGKDVSKTILVDVNENPIFMKNRAVLRTAEKRFDIYDDNGQLSFAIPLNDFDDAEILAAIASINASITALESDVAEIGTTANNAKAQSELNKEDIVSLTTTANAADSLSKANQSNLNELSTTVGGNAAAISANTKGIENNIAAIALKTDQADHDSLVTSVSSKAEQSELATVKATANEADALAKTNQNSITSINSTIGDIETEVLTTKQIAQKAEQDTAALGQTVGNNTTQITNNTKNIGDNTTAIDSKASQTDLNAVSATANAAESRSQSNASSITGLNSAVDNNTAAIATKANQTDLNAVAGTAGAADSRSQSNEAKLAGKVGIDSDASVNSLHNKTGNYNSDDNFDLKVNGTNVLSATQSAIYAKKNLVFQGDNALIKGVSNAVENKDAMNKQSVEALTNALSTRIDQIAEGTGDESDYISVHGFDGLVFEGQSLLEFIKSKNGDTECHVVFNAIRHATPASNTDATQWVMREFIHGDHPFWNFCPTNIRLKDGLVNIQHTSILGVTITITTESETLCKQMHYNFGTGSNGRRNDWQIWHPRVKGYEGFNVGQVLTDTDVTWSVSSNVRTNMQRLRDAIPNGCTYIGWHNHQSSNNRYKIIAKGNSSNIEGTSGSFIIWRHGGTSSTSGLYINSASTSAEGWARSYIGNANAWVTFGKQENKSTATRFEGVDKITIPFYEDPPELNLYVIASFTNDLLQTKAVDNDGEYLSVGRYGVNWDGTWTRDEAYHTAYYKQDSNTYIAFNYSTLKWVKFVAAKSHESIGLQAASSLISEFSERSQFPHHGDIYTDFGNLDDLPYEQITQPTIVHDTVAKTSTINFGAARWGYIEGGGVPDTSGEYPDDGMDPIETIEE